MNPMIINDMYRPFFIKIMPLIIQQTTGRFESLPSLLTLNYEDDQNPENADFIRENPKYIMLRIVSYLFVSLPLDDIIQLNFLPSKFAFLFDDLIFPILSSEVIIFLICKIILFRFIG